MKKFFLQFYILLFIGSVLALSCKKSYLDTKPTDAVQAVGGITNLTDAYTLINGIHRSLYMRYNAQGEGGQGAIMICSDAMGEDFVMSALGNNWYINTCRWVDHRNANGALPLFVYQFYYQVIANSNLILANIDNISGATADKQLLKAQAFT